MRLRNWFCFQPRAPREPKNPGEASRGGKHETYRFGIDPIPKEHQGWPLRSIGVPKATRGGKHETYRFGIDPIPKEHQGWPLRSIGVPKATGPSVALGTRPASPEKSSRPAQRNPEVLFEEVPQQRSRVSNRTAPQEPGHGSGADGGSFDPRHESTSESSGARTGLVEPEQQQQSVRRSKTLGEFLQEARERESESSERSSRSAGWRPKLSFSFSSKKQEREGSRSGVTLPDWLHFTRKPSSEAAARRESSEEPGCGSGTDDASFYPQQESSPDLRGGRTDLGGPEQQPEFVRHSKNLGELPHKEPEQESESSERSSPSGGWRPELSFRFSSKKQEGEGSSSGVTLPDWLRFTRRPSSKAAAPQESPAPEAATSAIAVSSSDDEGWDTDDVDALRARIASAARADNRWRPRLDAIHEGDEEDADIETALPETRKPLQRQEPGMSGAPAGAPSSSSVRGRRSAGSASGTARPPADAVPSSSAPSSSEPVKGSADPTARDQAVDRLEKVKAHYVALQQGNWSPDWKEVDYDMAVLPALVAAENARTPNLKLTLLSSGEDLAHWLGKEHPKDARVICTLPGRGVHRLAADVRRVGKKTSVIVIEPVSIQGAMRENFEKVILPALKKALGPDVALSILCLDTQKSYSLCQIFALSAASKLVDHASVMDALHRENLSDRPLKTTRGDDAATIMVAEGRNTIRVLDGKGILPPSFMKHSQSKTTLSAAMEAQLPEFAQAGVNKKGQSLTERFDSHLTTRYSAPVHHRMMRDVYGVHLPMKSKKISTSIEEKNLIYLDRAIDYLKRAPEKECAKVLAEMRRGFAGMVLERNPPGPNDLQLDRRELGPDPDTLKSHPPSS